VKSSRAVSELIVYTDGGCRGNPGGVGAWAFLLIDPQSGKALERAAAVEVTTNTRMEMLAAIEALTAIRARRARLVLHSDSKYLLNCCEKWIPGWKARGWTKKGGELKNVDLLQSLDSLIQRHDIQFRWVPGHSGDPGNERVDLLANEAMDRLSFGKAEVWERRFDWKR
jgi:ribonuclease HI